MNEVGTVITINLPESYQNIFEASCIEQGGLKCSHLEATSSLSEFLGNQKVQIECFFLYVESSVEELEKKVHYCHANFASTPVILIMGAKDFNILLSAFYTNVQHVIVCPLESIEIKQSLMKASLINQQSNADTQVPVTQLLQLFSSPIKLNDDVVIYSYLNDYFRQFSETQSFGLFYLKEKLTCIEGSSNLSREQLELIVKNYHRKENIVGTMHIEQLDEVQVVLFPIFQTKNYSAWGILELANHSAAKVMNHYVMNFLMGVFHYRRNKSKVENLQHLANTDEITGLYNQRKLASDLEQAIEEHENLHGTFSLMFIDIDHFKVVNDNYGHLVGSDILVQMGKVIKQQLRDSDHVYRYGGDEFIVIMPKIERDFVHSIALRVLNQISSIAFEVGQGRKHHLTVSIGICEYPTDAQSAKTILKFADDMMYKSKESGRGKVFHLKEVYTKS